MNARLASSFSPGGRKLQVQWGTDHRVSDLKGGQLVARGGAFSHGATRDGTFVTDATLRSAVDGRAVPLDAATGDAPSVTSCIVGSRVVPLASCRGPEPAR